MAPGVKTLIKDWCRGVRQTLRRLWCKVKIQKYFKTQHQQLDTTYTRMQQWILNRGRKILNEKRTEMKVLKPLKSRFNIWNKLFHFTWKLKTETTLHNKNLPRPCRNLRKVDAHRRSKSKQQCSLKKKLCLSKSLQQTSFSTLPANSHLVSSSKFSHLLEPATENLCLELEPRFEQPKKMISSRNNESRRWNYFNFQSRLTWAWVLKSSSQQLRRSYWQQ